MVYETEGHWFESSRARCGRSGLRDHKHNGHDSERDAADREHPYGTEPQRYVAARLQRIFQLALALRADEPQPDRESA